MKTFKELIDKERQEDYFIQLQSFLDQQYQNEIIYPSQDHIFKAFELCDFEDVKVVIIGQDPYHEPGQAQGLAFSVPQGIKIPPSLVNIYKELESDLNIVPAKHGDLTSWAKQGVLLMNNVLTVQQGKANSHRGRGWETFTLHMIEALSQREKPMVFILWGKNAMEKMPYIQSHHCVLTSPHPSPLSAYRGFFGSKPFSQTNDFLIQHHQEPIDWRIQDV